MAMIGSRDKDLFLYTEEKRLVVFYHAGRVRSGSEAWESLEKVKHAFPEVKWTTEEHSAELLTSLTEVLVPIINNPFVVEEV